MRFNSLVFASLLALVQTALALPRLDNPNVMRNVMMARNAMVKAARQVDESTSAPMNTVPAYPADSTGVVPQTVSGPAASPGSVQPQGTPQPIPPPNSSPPSAAAPGTPSQPAVAGSSIPASGPATPVSGAIPGAVPTVGGTPVSGASPATTTGATPAAAGAPEIVDGQTGRLIVFPPEPTDHGLKQIPDDAHPYVAPGPGDQRGPCPALNTLANHGYIPHNGIATPAEILTAVMEAFNMEHDFGSFIVSFATLARGNAFTGQLSIGGVVDEIPPLPGMIDGTEAGGIAKHGRFEGDVSSTRKDVHVGDNVNFQNDNFDTLLSYVGAWGEDGPDGKHSVVTIKAFQEFKYDAYMQDQAEDPELEFHVGRQLTTYSEVAFILDLFANGTDGKLSQKALGSIFRNQTFAENWFRRAAPANLTVLSGTGGLIMGAHPIPPGMNVNGVYVPDEPHFTNFLCDAYADLAGNQLAYTLNTTTGILWQNVVTLTDAIYKPFKDTAGCAPKVWPHGPAGV